MDGVASECVLDTVVVFDTEVDVATGFPNEVECTVLFVFHVFAPSFCALVVGVDVVAHVAVHGSGEEFWGEVVLESPKSAPRFGAVEASGFVDRRCEVEEVFVVVFEVGCDALSGLSHEVANEVACFEVGGEFQSVAEFGAVFIGNDVAIGHGAENTGESEVADISP